MSLPPGPEQAPHQPDINVKDYFAVIRRRRMIFLQVFVLVMAVGLVVTALSKPVYATKTTLLVPNGSATVNVLDTGNPLNQVFNRAQPDSIRTQLQVLQSSAFQERARKRAGVGARTDVPPASVRIDTLDEKSNIIQVSVEGGDKDEIVRLANEIVELHLEETDEQQNRGISSALKFVREEQKKATLQLARADRNLLTFKKKYKVTEAEVQREADAKDYVELASKVRATQSNLTTTRAQIKELQARLKTEPELKEQVTKKENARRGKLQEQLEDLKDKLAEAAPQYLPNHRIIVDLNKQIASVEERIAKQEPILEEREFIPNPRRLPMETRLAELEVELQGLEADYNSAEAQLATRKGVFSNIGVWETQLTRLTHERDAAQASYDNFSKHLADLELRDKAQTPQARVIELANVPDAPIKPRKEVNLALAGLLALCLAGGMAFLQEFMDDRVNSPDDLERVSSLPSLGHVPLMDGEQTRLVASLPANSHVAEAYRGLRSSIGFAGIDTPMRRLQVTSASKGEGKTVTSVNLAMAMAMDGKKVILVDADMRRPSVHRVLNVVSSPGLSEVLAGLRTVDEAIHDTEVEGLRVICAGSIPPNPAELLGSRAFDQLIEQLEEMADVVIFDTPPSMPVTDPLIVASRMDGVVLVLHVGQTKKAVIKHVEELLRRARARVVGVVFNRVQHSKSGYYYYHYYYSSGDGYYSDAAGRGERTRRGRKSKPELEAGTKSIATRSSDDDD